MRRISFRSLVGIFAFCLAYFGFAAALDNAYYRNVLTMVPIFAVLGLSWNLLGGYAGVISFGQAAFFGIGAMTVAILFVELNVSPWLGIPAGTCVSAVAAVLIGLPTLRLRGVHFALAMLAYPIVLQNILNWLRYQEVILPSKASDPWQYMEFQNTLVYAGFATLMLCASLVVSLLVENSRLGLSLLAIKLNEQAAEAAGINVWQRKMIATAMSGAMAGTAGALYVVVIRVAVPADVFGLHVSAQAMVVTLFGGVGTLWGPLIGAAFLIPLGEFLHVIFGHTIPGVNTIVYGIALVLVVLVAPEGIYWFARDRIGSRLHRAINPASTDSDEVAQRSSENEPGDHGSSPRQRDCLFVQRLSKSFRGLKAVQDVSFAVPEGSIYGLIGQNGAGKTTVFNLLNGFIKADSGNMNFGEHQLSGMMPNQISRLGIGRTFQVARPFLRLSVLENVIVGAISTEPDDAAAMARCRAALASVGLLHRENVLAAQVNALELRLLELARAIAGQPKLLLLDEIFAGLANDEIERLLVVIRRLPAQGITVMIIEHTMQAMLRICDHLLVLDHGVVIASGIPDEVVNNPKVIEAYLGKKWMSENAAA